MEIHFGSENLLILNVILGFMMFGVSLSLTGDDFRRVLKRPDAPIVGLLAQFVLLPAATCVTTWYFEVDPELALGMILVASCPGGSFSNIMTWLGRANVAVSVSMTAVSSVVAIVMTPFNFSLYGWLNPITRPILTDIQMDSMNILILVALVLGLPLLVGMLMGKAYLRKKPRSPCVMSPCWCCCCSWVWRSAITWMCFWPRRTVLSGWWCCRTFWRWGWGPWPA